MQSEQAQIDMSTKEEKLPETVPVEKPFTTRSGCFMKKPAKFKDMKLLEAIVVVSVK